MPKTFCIVGGGGYVGWNLARSLLNEGHNVRLYDLRYPEESSVYDGAEIIQGNILDHSKLQHAIFGCDGVFHLAAYGMTGRESLNDRLVYDVNVTGTENVLRACLHANVTRLVYASTTDVVWCNAEIHMGTEKEMPYLQDHEHVDNYGRTKTIAEKYVLSHDGAKCNDSSKTLRTCALRFHGIYGPGEIRSTHRVLNSIRDGQVVMFYGTDSRREPRIQYVSGSNCVQACVLAYDALGAQRSHIAGGQAYFIVDGSPVPTFSFWRPAFEYFNQPVPGYIAPFWFMYWLAFFMELVCRVLPLNPLLTRKDVNHSGVPHTFSIDKAKRELGYKPYPVDLQAVLDHYREHTEPKLSVSKVASRYDRIIALWPFFLALALLTVWFVTYHWVSFVVFLSVLAVLAFLLVRYCFN